MGLLALAVLLGGCSDEAVTDAAAPDRSSGSPHPTSATASGPTVGPDASAAAALDRLLAIRDAAVLAGDRDAYAATVADPGSPSGARQLRGFDAARRLRPAVLTHDAVPTASDPAAVDVVLRYRVADLDRGDRTATVRYTLRERSGRWLVAAETPRAPGAAPAWLAMPDLKVVRTARAVVAGTAPRADLTAAADTVDRALPALRPHWSGTPGRALVLLPDTTAEADALTGGPSAGTGSVAALTDGPLDADGRATGDRVVLDPEVRRRLTATGQDVVLTHELAHVAVRATLAGSAPLWLTEGYADHVGYERADLPQRRLAAPLLEEVRDGTAPTGIPGADALDPAAGDLVAGYLAAWQVAETVVDLGGEDGLRRLVAACTVRGGEDAAEQTCTAAMPRVLGTDRAGLTRRWQQRLDRLAR